MHFFCKFTLAKKNKQPLVVWLYIFTPLLRDLETKSEKKSLWKHCRIQHGGKNVQFKMDALGAFKYSMVRQDDAGAIVVSGQQSIPNNLRLKLECDGEALFYYIYCIPFRVVYSFSEK